MRKKIFVFSEILLVFCSILYLQYGRKLEVVSTINNTYGKTYEQKITVVANKLFIRDKEKFAEMLIDHCKENDFKDVKFSYDMLGHPDKIVFTVYPSELCMKMHQGSWEINVSNP